MTAETEVPYVPKHKPNPIGSTAGFIGLCTLRNGAFQALWWRARDGVAFNTAGLIAAFYVLVGDPSWKALMLVWLGAPLALYFNGDWRQLLNSAVVVVEYWTEELVQLEEVNGMDGGCSVFARSQFPSLGGKPRVPKVLRRIRRACMVLWGVVGVIAFITFLCHKEVLPWSLVVWRYLSSLLGL